MTERIGFTGTQRGMSVYQKRILTDLLIMHQPMEIHYGMCIGADTELHHIFFLLKTKGDIKSSAKIIGHPPKNKKKYVWRICHEYWSEKDYMDRNHDIVRESQLLIGCPMFGMETIRSGTWATIRYARFLRQRRIVIPYMQQGPVVEEIFKAR